MDLDQALQASDPLGRTQFLIFAASVLMNMETGMTILSHVFLAEVPPHHCAYNSTYSLNESIPTDGSHYAQCEEYINPPFTNETQACSNGWTYDTKATGKSIVSEWDLVCDKDFLPGVSQSLLMAGFGLGSVIGGPLADVYGRRPTVIGSLILFNAIGLSVSLAPNFALFVILRHLMGGIFKSIRIPLINLMYEFLPPKHRPIMGLIPSLTTMLGYVLMTGFGYFVRDWRYFHLLIMSPCVILMAFSWFIPESVRWIISQGDMEKAEMTMQKVAKFNKATNFPNPVFSNNYSIDAGNASSHSSQAKEGESDSAINDDKPKRQTGVQAAVALFKQPVLTVTVVLSFEWIAGTMIFFGFTLTTGSLAGNPFVNFILICVVDLPARILAILLVKKIGNIKPLFFGFFGAGVTMVMIAILPYLVGWRKHWQSSHCFGRAWKTLPWNCSHSDTPNGRRAVSYYDEKFWYSGGSFNWQHWKFIHTTSVVPGQIFPGFIIHHHGCLCFHCNDDIFDSSGLTKYCSTGNASRRAGNV